MAGESTNKSYPAVNTKTQLRQKNEESGVFAREVGRWGFRRGLYASLMQRLQGSLGLFVAHVYRAELKKYSGQVPSELKVILATPQDLAPYTQLSEYQLKDSFVQGASARGDACVATYYHGKLAAYGWVAYDRAPHVDGMWVRFGQGHRYNYKSLTLPEFRGRHLRGSYGVLAQRDRDEGVTHTIAFIETHNYASISAEKRHGGHKIGFAGYLRIAGRLFVFSSAGAKRFGFSFEAPD